VIHDKHGKNTLDDLDGDLEDIFDEGELTTISKGGASVTTMTPTKVLPTLSCNLLGRNPRRTAL